MKADLSKPMIAAIPRLRAYAASLCRNREDAEDLLQSTLLKGWAKLDAFEAGSNMDAWMFTIMRNHFYSEYRRKRGEARRINNPVGAAGTNPTQFARLAYSEFCNALGNLEPSDRRALLLVGATGLSYGEVASLCGCPIGTVKSRVSRARTTLARRLEIGKRKSLFEADAVFSAATAGADRPGVHV